MVFGSYFTSRAKSAPSIEAEASNAQGFLRVAFPSWTIPGVRVVADVADVERTSRREIEDMFSLELNRVRLGSVLSANEIKELDMARSLRHALYDTRIAA